MTPDAGQLPADVLSMIADCVDVQDLLALSHVCVRWHAVARAHPTFWRDIRLAALSETALELFQARVDTSGGRGINIYLHIPEYPFSSRIRDVVIPTVTRSLCRVVELSLGMHSTTAPHIISGILEPAPLLENLCLQFFYHRKGQSVVTLPPDLLGRTSPRLVDLSLMNVQLSEEPILAFHRVHSMTFHFRRQPIIPARMFDQFPALQNLVINGDARLRVESTDGTSTALNVPPLKKLELRLTRCDYDPIMSSFPNIASASHIVCYQPREHISEQLVGHLLGGHLQLDFLCLGDTVHIVLHELPTNRVRSLVEPIHCIIEDMPHNVLFSPSRLERYETLRIFASLGYLAPHIEALPQCRTLEIILESKGGLPLLSADIAPLRLPELRAVVVDVQKHPSRFIAVDAEQLCKYLSQLLGDRTERLSLRLRGVVVTGDRAGLSGLFAVVLS